VVLRETELHLDYLGQELLLDHARRVFFLCLFYLFKDYELACKTYPLVPVFMEGLSEKLLLLAKEEMRHEQQGSVELVASLALESLAIFYQFLVLSLLL